MGILNKPEGRSFESKVFAEITVKNAADITLARKGQLSEKEIRSVTLKALVDTGATTLIINDEICSQLGLETIRTRTANLAGGGKGQCKETEAVQIQWKDRFVTINAIAFPEGQPLLGVIPLEYMDLMINPVTQELTGVHGDQQVFMAM